MSRLIESFGVSGVIDLRQHLPVGAESASIEVTTPGIVYLNVLIIGSRVPEGNASTPGGFALTTRSPELPRPLN